ncbi:glycosyltransferase family 2 protein [Moheibacter stercoris]|uniref:GT2 family glycosyltransferase n=1 Tax=Moheibacter stercoris TaxID=1628251 RepID=A0ABV2LVJ8_9FLAO
MKTAIAILNWNGRNLLEEFLPSVVEHSTEADIYVIDNASTDSSLEFISSNYPNIKIIQLDDNYGYAIGYNKGIQKILALDSSIEIFCLLNSDVKVSQNWLAPILNLFQTDSSIAAIQPKILDYKNPSKFEYAGAGGGFIDNYGFPFCRGRVFWTLEEDKGQFNDTTQVFWASGACMFIRTKDFLEQQGFDEGFFAHMEEIDLCWRLNNAGRKIYYCGESTVYHLGGGTLKNNSARKTYLNFRNSLWMLVKNLPAWKAFPFVFLRLSLDGITGIVFLFYEGFPHFWAVIDSHFGFYKRLFHYMNLRKPGISGYSDKKLIPFQYFIQKRKFYKDLK